MGIGAEIKDFDGNLYFFKSPFCCDFYTIWSNLGRPSERGDQDLSEYVWHIGVGSYFFTDISCQSLAT